MQVRWACSDSKMVIETVSTRNIIGCQTSEMTVNSFHFFDFPYLIVEGIFYCQFHFSVVVCAVFYSLNQDNFLTHNTRVTKTTLGNQLNLHLSTTVFQQFCGSNIHRFLGATRHPNGLFCSKQEIV